MRSFSNSASILMSWSNADANCSYVHCLQSTGTKHSQRASTYCWETCGQTNEIFNKEYASCEFNCILIYQALAKIWLWHNLHRRLAFLYFYYLFLNKNALFHLHAQSSIWLLMCRIFTFVCNRYNEHKFQYKQRKVRRFMCGNLAFHSMCRGLLSKPQAFKISRPSLPHLNVTCSLRWAILKIHFCLFLLVRVTVYAGSATHYHLILLILKHMLPLVTAVWATLGKKKIYIYIYTYIFLHVCLMSVDNFVTTCHDLLHSACQTALCSTLFLLTLFLQRQLCPRLRLCMFVARWKSKLDNSSSAISEACCVVREHSKEMSG